MRRKCELGKETCLQWVRGGRGRGGDIRVCTIRFVAHDREKKGGRDVCSDPGGVRRPGRF